MKLILKALLNARETPALFLSWSRRFQLAKNKLTEKLLLDEMTKFRQ